jgi:SNF2 family DNA or RNA helicase
LTIPGLNDLTLFDFQKIGTMAIVDACPRMILGDFVGAGKSIQSGAAIVSLWNMGCLSTQDVLIVCPNPTRIQWASIFKKYTPLKPLIGETSDKTCSYLKKRFNVLILGFSTVRQRIDILEKHPFKFEIFDEGLFKSPESQINRALKRLSLKVNRLLILNATPFENHLDEIYAHIDLINPTLFSSKEDFMQRFCKIHTTWFRTKYKTLKSTTKIVGVKSMESLQELKQLMSSFYLARTHGEVDAQMPEKVVKDIFVDLKPCQKKEYLEEIKKFQDHKIKASQLLFFLLRICDGSKNKMYGEPDPTKISSKIEALLNLAESLGNEQVILYSTYLDPLFTCGKVLKSKLGKKLGFFTGQQSDKERNKHLEEFKGGDRDWLLITQAASRGLNIETCRNMVELNQLYNPSAIEQLEGRISRISSKHKNIFIYKLLTRNTVEERVLALQAKKQEFANILNEDGETVSSNLTDDQMNKLLGKDSNTLLDSDFLDISEESFKNDLGIE